MNERIKDKFQKKTERERLKIKCASVSVCCGAGKSKEFDSSLFYDLRCMWVADGMTKIYYLRLPSKVGSIDLMFALNANVIYNNFLLNFNLNLKVNGSLSYKQIAGKFKLAMH